MRRRFSMALVLVLLLLTGLGCAPTENKKAAAPQKVTMVLDWFPNTNHTGLYVARDRGYYRRQGLDVSIIQPGDTGAAALVASGKADFGISYQEEVTMARSQGVPVVAVAAVVQHNTSGFASPVDRNIKTPADFVGKRYGGWGGPSEKATLDILMKKYGHDVSQVKIINIGSADFFTSVQRDIDFSWIYWGWTGIEAEQRGMKLNYISLRDLDPVFDYYTPVIITSEQMIKNHPQTVKAFMAATAQGYQYSIKNPQSAADILIKAAPALNSQLVKASQQYLSPRYQDDATRWGVMKPEVWKRYADWLYQNHVLSQPVDTSKAFTNQFLP